MCPSRESAITVCGRGPRRRWTSVIAALLLAGCSILAGYEIPPERCDNGIDDDTDGLADCEDPDCGCEDLALYCADFEDNDGDGLVDAQEPVCWQWSQVGSRIDPAVLPPEDTTARACSSLLATDLALGPSDFRWSGGALPDGGATVPLSGGEQCAGLGLVTETCRYLHATRLVSGGACWSVTVDFDFDDGDPDSELAVVLGPEIDPARPPLGARVAAILGVRRLVDADGTRLLLRYSAGGAPTIAERADAPPGPFRLRVDTGPDCRFDALRIDLSPAAGGAPLLSLGPDGLSLPADWSSTVLALGLQAATQGTVGVDAIAVHRDRFDPCGFAMPQITAGEPGGRDALASVLAAARGDGVICAIGVTPSAPLVEPAYDPRRDQGTPPELPPGDPELPSLPFASWHAEDRGLESFGEGAVVDGPFAADVRVRSAALAWDAGARSFAAVLLRSDDARSGGTLVSARSPDCETWTVEELESLDSLGAQHPLLLEADTTASRHRLVLAKAGDGYERPPDPDCPDEAGFTAPGDAVPWIKPMSSECVGYPRAGLVEATSEDGRAWAVTDAGELPAFPSWQTGCDCPRTEVLALDDRAWPAAVRHVVDEGGTRAFVASGRDGLEIVLDVRRDARTDVADARALDAPLLLPSAVRGSFDAAAVRDGVLLLLDPDPWGRSGLVFYRGFEDVATGDDGRVRFVGGTVGVVPVRFERQTEPDEAAEPGGGS